MGWCFHISWMEKVGENVWIGKSSGSGLLNRARFLSAVESCVGIMVLNLQTGAVSGYEGTVVEIDLQYTILHGGGRRVLIISPFFDRSHHAKRREAKRC